MKSISKKWLKQPSDICVPSKSSRSSNCYNNFSKKMGVYIINCKMHKQRYTDFKKYAKKAGVKACRIPCVLGKKFSDKDLCNMVKHKMLSPSADMTRVEVSINMSHYNAWVKLLNSCNEYAMIFEDDVKVKVDFIDNINLILDSLENKKISFSILHLYNGNWMKTISRQKKILSLTNEIKILQETVPYNAAASAYIISRNYAKWLVEHSFPIHIPQDILMGSYPTRGKHLTLKMSWDKHEGCYKSPLLDLECGGEGGTGKSTQTYDAPTIENFLSCGKGDMKSNPYRYDGVFDEEKNIERINKNEVKKSNRPKKRYAILFSMYIGDTKERRDIYENRIGRWLEESKDIDLYTTDSSNNYLFFDKMTGKATSKHFYDPRLHQFAFQQKKGFQSGNPSVPERNAMLEALEHFNKEFKQYDIVFKITGKYFIPHFDEKINFDNIPKGTQIVFQNRTDTAGQNTEVIGFAPSVFKEIIVQIDDDTTIEELVAGINKKKLYKTYRLPKLKLDAFTKRSDGSTLRYLFSS